MKLAKISESWSYAFEIKILKYLMPLLVPVNLRLSEVLDFSNVSLDNQRVGEQKLYVMHLNFS